MSDPAAPRDRPTIGEIRRVLGNEGSWVTRRALKNAGHPSPTEQDLTAWRETPPAWFVRENERRANRQAVAEAAKVAICCPACGFTIRVTPRVARRARDYEGLYCARRACGYSPPRAVGLLTVVTMNAVSSFTGWRHEFPDDEQLAAVLRAQRLAEVGRVLVAKQRKAEIRDA